MRWHRKRYGININGRRLTNLRFADDIVIFAHRARELQEMLRDLNTKSKEVGLSQNPTKDQDHDQLYRNTDYNRRNKEYCKEYPHLGQNTSMAGEKETQRRIRQAWGAFWNLKFTLLNK
jgi:calcineurin-like phosphoesterase family protein